MKVLLLADINSIHSQKWATALHIRGVDMAIFSLTRLSEPNPELEGILVFHPDHFNRNLSSSGLIEKTRYFTTLPYLKKCIRNFAPDIVHAHYASSYGALGALCGFHPFILSVWGSDVYDFAKRSPFTGLMMRFNLGKADRILSTSNAMAEEIWKYTRRQIAITPFGIDPDIFKPYIVQGLFSRDEIVIGTTKSLEPVYGNDVLIRVFGQLQMQHPELPLRLLITGGGSMENALKELVYKLGLGKQVVFTGKVTHKAIPDYLNMLDIFAALSFSESFGVSVIEASACGLPVVTTNVGGLKEVVEDRITGLLVPPNNIGKCVESFERLIFDKELRVNMGKNGRERVKKMYNWNDNVAEMIKIYQGVL